MAGIVACHDVTAPVAVPSTRVQPQWVTGEAAGDSVAVPLIGPVHFDPVIIVP